MNPELLPKYTFNIQGFVSVYGEYDEMDAREIAEAYLDLEDADIIVGTVADMELGDEHA
jgi:hypothetical protein